MTRRTYLDFSATAPVRPEVIRAMEPFLGDRFGNSSSVHAFGREARIAVEESRDKVRAALGVDGGSLVFTGSGTEADNLAVLGFARRRPGARVIRSSIEHKAVIQSTKQLAAGGYDVCAAPVDSEGVLDVEALVKLLPDDDRATLVTVMWANNETGAVQPLERVADLCRERGAALHSDAVQALGKLPLSGDAVGVDMIAISGHKFGGPQGVGALWVRDGIELEPVIFGGGHQGGLRAGTENVAGCVGLAKAAEMAVSELGTEAPRLRALRDELQAGLEATIEGLVVNAGGAPERLPNVLNVSVPEVDIEGLLTALDLEGICVSSGSACMTGSVEPSNVITAMGREGDLADNTLRLSLGWSTQKSDIDHALEVIPQLVQRVREFAHN